MTRAKASGLVPVQADVAKILAMIARGDRQHDIAAWFGLNQGRIKEVEDRDHGSPPLAASNLLPPTGSPGPRVRKLRADVENIVRVLQAGGAAQAAISALDRAITDFDKPG